MKIPEEGEKIKRLVEIAQERNIDYKPSVEAYTALNEYCDRKGIPNPLHSNGKKVEIPGMQAPQYNPMPPPTNFMPPPAYHPPPGDGFGGPGQMGQAPPGYMPPSQPYVAMGEPT